MVYIKCCPDNWSLIQQETSDPVDRKQNSNQY